MKKRPIIILTGTPAAGKTTVAKALLQQFAYGVHIPVDWVRGLVVSGLSNPIGSWDAETERQFRLARDSAAQIAKTYAAGGFAVVVDDVIFPDAVAHHYGDVLAEFEVYRVLLRPAVETAVSRNTTRTIDVDNAQLAKIIRPIYEHFATFDLEQMQQEGWIILDTTTLSVEETVSAIIFEMEK